MKRPNILLITTDQQRADHSGLQSTPGLHTPNLDRLGQEGICFDRAYTCSPLCTPARLSLITGQYPSVHCGWTIGSTPDPFPRPMLVEQLNKAGYRTGIVGKHHFVSRRDEDAHIRSHVPEAKDDPDFYRNHHGPYVGFQAAYLSTGHTTNTRPAEHYRVFLEDAGVDFSQWFPQESDPACDLRECGSWNIPVEYHDTRWCRETAERVIGDFSDGEQPWFVMLNFQDPHSPWRCPEPYYSAVKEEEIETYADFRAGEFDDRPAFYNDLHRGDYSSTQDAFKTPCCYPHNFVEGNHENKMRLRATIGMVHFIDDEIGHLLAFLERTGQLDHTLIIFTSDHGELHGHHGLWEKGLPAYEDCQRIPMLMRGPAVHAKGKSDALISLADLPKTILHSAGVEIPQGMQGISQLPVLSGECDSVRDACLIELRATEQLYQKTLVTDRYKLVLYEQLDEGELYDLQNDPNQYSNLWKNPEYAQLRQNLMHQMIRTEMTGEGTRHARVGFA